MNKNYSSHNKLDMILLSSIHSQKKIPNSVPKIWWLLHVSLPLWRKWVEKWKGSLKLDPWSSCLYLIQQIVFLSIRGWQSFPFSQHRSTNSQSKHKKLREEGESLSLKNPHLSTNLELRAQETSRNDPSTPNKGFWRKMK